MNHSFDVDLAVQFGIEEAIIIENLAFWIKKNVANNKNFIEGEYWTYNTCKAFNELFPYMNPRKIARVLEKLEKENIIKSDNFNKAKYDRTKWYCIIDNDIKNKYKIPINVDNYSFDKMTNGFDKMTNGFVQNDKPIPDINTDINTYIKTCTCDMNFEKEEKEDFGINPKGFPRKDKWEKFLNENLQGIDYVPNIELAIKSFENNLIKKGALNPEKEVKDFLVNNYKNGIQQNLSLNVIANSIITGKRIEQVKVNTIEIENNDNVKTEIIAPVTRIEKIKFMKNILSENELSKYREKVSKELLENYNISEKSVIESELDNYLILLYNKKYKNEVA